MAMRNATRNLWPWWPPADLDARCPAERRLGQGPMQAFDSPAPDEPAICGRLRGVRAAVIESGLGMIGFDDVGRGRAASREAPISLNQRTNKVPIALTMRLCRSLPNRIE